jgi:hypothetical protein
MACVLNPYSAVIELLLIPTVLFVWLLKLRDRCDVSHIPYADIVALVAIVDGALFLNPELLKHANLYIREAPLGTAREFYCGLFLASCWLARALVVHLEKDMAPIMIQEMDVGFRHRRIAVVPLRDRFNRNWRAYSWRYLVSWLSLAALISIRVVCLADRRELLFGALVRDTGALAVTKLTVGIAAVAFLTNVVSTGIGYLRFGVGAARYTEQGVLTLKKVS